MPNQKDVARLAGVSHASVSRYLADPEAVSEGNRERIREAIEMLNYKVDAAAQTLRTGRTKHVSILVPGSAPFYWVLVQAMEKRLSEEGYFSSVLFTREFDQLVSVKSGMVDKMIQSNLIEACVLFPLLKEEDERLAERIHRYHKNFLVVDNSLLGAHIPRVVFDNYEAGKTAAREILKKGHRDILLLTGDEIFESAVMRKKGFLDGVAEAGHPEECVTVIKTGFSPQVAYPHLERIKLPPFTAVFAANDTTALAFINVAYQKGLLCPRDYEIIGFDNNTEYTPYSIPTLSTFHQPTFDAGVKTADLVLDMINGKPIPYETVFPAELIRRQSFS